MIRTAALSAIGLFIVGSIGVWAQSPEAIPVKANLFDYSNPEAVARGQDIYALNCASCHGANLEGQENWRIPNENGRLPAPPHDISGHTWHHPDEQLFAIVKYGTAALVGNGYESDMAGYEDILSDEEIRDIMAYIKSTWPADIIERHDEMNAAVAAQR